MYFYRLTKPRRAGLLGTTEVPSTALRTGSSLRAMELRLKKNTKALHSEAVTFCKLRFSRPAKAGLKSSLFLTRHSAAAPCRATFIRACRHSVPFDTNLSGLN